MANIYRGCLLLVDITGYAKYLSGVELEHSQDVLADLMNVLVDQMRGLLHLAKLEGDAVFSYAHEADVDGAAVLALVESCYFAFARRVRTIHQHTTCECDACRLIPRLNLKFMGHYGEYVIHEVAGSRELVGRDVVLAHRLLKNSVTEKTGLRGYALFTDACLKHYALDPSALGMLEHSQSYEDVGEITAFVIDLEARWEAEQKRQTVYVAPGETTMVLEYDVPVPPPIAWEFLTSPSKRPLWQTGVQQVVQRNPSGVIGVGTTNHCIHGRGSIDEEILDWKPYRYFTFRVTIRPFGEFLITSELIPLDMGDRTRLSFRWLPQAGPIRRLWLRLFVPMFRARAHLRRDNLRRLLAAVQVEADERRPPPRDGWIHDRLAPSAGASKI